MKNEHAQHVTFIRVLQSNTNDNVYSKLEIHFTCILFHEIDLSMFRFRVVELYVFILASIPLFKWACHLNILRIQVDAQNSEI